MIERKGHIPDLDFETIVGRDAEPDHPCGGHPARPKSGSERKSGPCNCEDREGE